jgi:hypothetical protein
MQAAVLLACIALIPTTLAWTRWDLPWLASLTVFTAMSELTSVSDGKVRVSGTMMGVMFGVIFLGAGAAACVGGVAILAGWVRFRESAQTLRTNLVTYVCFPLVSGLFFHEVTRFAQVGPHDPGYYPLVISTFFVAIVVNFSLIAAHQSRCRPRAFLEVLRSELLPVATAEAFSACLLAAAAFFLFRTGLPGLGILGVTLMLFQYLVGELLRAKVRGDELRRDSEELGRLRQHCAELEQKLALADQAPAEEV